MLCEQAEYSFDATKLLAAGKLLGVRASQVVVREAEEFREGAVKRGKSETEEYTRHDKVLCIMILDETLAAAKVQVSLSVNSPRTMTCFRQESSECGGGGGTDSSSSSSGFPDTNNSPNIVHRLVGAGP
jgi:hypothetical protein